VEQLNVPRRRQNYAVWRRADLCEARIGIAILPGYFVFTQMSIWRQVCRLT
jgi:hypothetical protein